MVNISKYLDRLVPGEVQNNIVLTNKARMLIGISFLMGFIVPMTSIQTFYDDKNLLGMVLIASSAFSLACPYVFYKSRSLLLGSSFFLTVFLATLTALCLSFYGSGTIILIYFSVFVIFAYMLTNLRAGTVWGLISMSIVLLLYFTGWRAEPFHPIQESELVVEVVSILGLCLALGIVYEASNASNIKSLMRERENTVKVSRQQNELLTDANRVMAAVANGDLAQRISVDLEGDLGQLKTSVNSALSILCRTMSEVMATSADIHSGTTELTSAAQTLARGNTQQAGSLEEISSSMNEIGNMAKTTNKNASITQDLSNQTNEDLQRGNCQMEVMLASMKEINDTSSNVSKVIKTIDEIAFQTNLLALNAAVEAARAGKYGKGFAVVAEEVRNLAARSAEAAKDTTSLIESSIKEVEKGVGNTDQTAVILKSFVENIEKMNDLIGEISTASNEQSNAVNEINAGLSQVNRVVQQNSSISEETASASQELQSCAQRLKDLMADFNLGTKIQSRFQKRNTPKQAVMDESAIEKKTLPELKRQTPFNPQQEKTPPSVFREAVILPQRKIILDDNEFGKY